MNRGHFSHKFAFYPLRLGDFKVRKLNKDYALYVAYVSKLNYILFVYVNSLRGVLYDRITLCNGTRPLSQCYHDKMTVESLLNQFKSENSFLDRRTYPHKSYISVELVKACVVLDMFKTFIRSGKSVVQLLKNEVLFFIILVFSSALALQCLKIALVFLAGLFVSSCSIFYHMIVGNIVKVGG